jgi:hypothetical protein
MLNDSFFFLLKKNPCTKTIRGMLGGGLGACFVKINLCWHMPCQKKKKNKGTSWFCDGYVRILPIKFLIKSCFFDKVFLKICRGEECCCCNSYCCNFGHCNSYRCSSNCWKSTNLDADKEPSCPMRSTCQHDNGMRKHDHTW